MNRTGLLVALGIGVGVGVVFAVWPQLDIAISRAFFDPAHGIFPFLYNPVAPRLRDFFNYTIAALVAPAALALLLKLVLPRRRMLIAARAAVFLIATLALAPGLMANVVLKENWSRPRPIEVKELGGELDFVPWWDPRGSCDKNCSFVAGEGAGSFWTLALAAVAPPAWRALAYAGALLFGAAAGTLRIIAGAHFFSDVAFSGVFTFLIIWLAHGLIYRWRATRLTDAQVEHAIEWVALAPRRLVARFFGAASEREAG
ncbi:MAG TPA: phosphatase PAP2 family protein [Xanthobacteraceae bacterium]|nr:phosphatase PAP2 family protein [Xanthobacteraceae bacterium]